MERALTFPVDVQQVFQAIQVDPELLATKVSHDYQESQVIQENQERLVILACLEVAEFQVTRVSKVYTD